MKLCVNFEIIFNCDCVQYFQLLYCSRWYDVVPNCANIGSIACWTYSTYCKRFHSSRDCIIAACFSIAVLYQATEPLLSMQAMKQLITEFAIKLEFTNNQNFLFYREGCCRCLYCQSLQLPLPHCTRLQ